MAASISSGLTNPLRLNRLVGIGIDYVTIDSAFSSTDVYRLARRFRSSIAKGSALRLVGSRGCDAASGLCQSGPVG
jgi:hypothetical protein